MKGVWAVAALLATAVGCAAAPPPVHALPDSPDCRRNTGRPPLLLTSDPGQQTPEAAADSLVRALGHSQRTEAWQRRSESGDRMELAAAPYLIEVRRSGAGGWLGDSIRECLVTWDR